MESRQPTYQLLNYFIRKHSLKSVEVIAFLQEQKPKKIWSLVSKISDEEVKLLKERFGIQEKETPVANQNLQNSNDNIKTEKVRITGPKFLGKIELPVDNGNSSSKKNNEKKEIFNQFFSGKKNTYKYDEKRPPRLLLTAFEFNISSQTLIFFLQDKGYDVDDLTPSSKLTQEMYLDIKRNFHSDKIHKKESDKIKLPVDSGNYLEKSHNKKKLDHERNRNISQQPINVIQDHPIFLGHVAVFDRPDYGFINELQKKESHFFHLKNIGFKDIKRGDLVSFNLRPGRYDGKFECYNVKLINSINDLLDELLEIVQKFGISQIRNFFKGTTQSVDIELADFLIKNLESNYFIFFNNNNFLKELHSLLSSLNEKTRSTELLREFYRLIDLFGTEDQKKEYYFKSEQKINLKEESLIDIFAQANISIKVEMLNSLNVQNQFKAIEILKSEEGISSTFRQIISIIEKANQIEDLEVEALFKTGTDVSLKFWPLYEYALDTLIVESTNKDVLNLVDNHLIPINEIPINIFYHDEWYLDNLERILDDEYLLSETKNAIIDKIFVEHFDSYDIIDEGNTILSKGLNSLDKYLPERNFFLTYLRLIIESPFKNKITEYLTNISISENYLIPIILQTKYNFSSKIEQAIDYYFRNSLKTDEGIKFLIEKLNFKPDKALHAALSSLNNFKSLDDSFNAEAFENLIKVYKAKGLSNTIIKKNLKSVLHDYFNLQLWLLNDEEKLNFTSFKNNFPFLTVANKLKFIRKLFYYKEKAIFDLKTSHLEELYQIDNQIKHSRKYLDSKIDITADVVLASLLKYTKHRRFLIEGEILQLLLNGNIYEKKAKFEISTIFEKCEGRMVPDFDFYSGLKIAETTNGFTISLNYDESLISEIKQQLPGRQWNQTTKNWQVPLSSKKQVYAFALKHKAHINTEGAVQSESNLREAVQFKRLFVPLGITFCEGRLANQKDKKFGAEFYWCRNSPCYQNCETQHKAEQWEAYNFLDFCRLLGFDLTSSDRLSQEVKMGEYYKFTATLNRFEKIKDHLYCRECEEILYPQNDSFWALYRVTDYSCTNNNCSKKGQKIYLHHCLNGKCSSVIDSRDTKKCNNGLYICTNKECGCCCSDRMFKERYNNLEMVDIPDTNAKAAVYGSAHHHAHNKTGHMELGIHFCFKCGGQMVETANEIFNCKDCNITYDLKKTALKRTNKNINQNKSKSNNNKGDEPPPPFDSEYRDPIDDFWA